MDSTHHIEAVLHGCDDNYDYIYVQRVQLQPSSQLSNVMFGILRLFFHGVAEIERIHSDIRYCKRFFVPLVRDFPTDIASKDEPVMARGMVHLASFAAVTILHLAYHFLHRGFWDFLLRGHLISA